MGHVPTVRVEPALQAAAAYEREYQAGGLPRQAVPEQGQQVGVRAATEQSDLAVIRGGLGG